MKFPWPARSSRRPLRLRLAVEGLEDRALMSALVYVVPITQAVDATHRHSLADAIPYAGSGGEVIIEPGATPDAGTVNVTVDTLTIVGDPNVAGGSLPRYDVNVQADNVQLNNLNLGDVTVADTANGLIVANSLIGSFTELGAVSGAGGNLLLFNVFTGPVDLQGNSGLFQVTGDQVAHNRFLSAAPIMLKLTNSNLTSVYDNTFVGDGTSQVGIQVRSNSDQVTVGGNRVQLTGSGAPIGIYLVNTGGAAGNILGAKVFDNVVETGGNGVGLYMNIFGTGASFAATVEGNQLNANKVGVDINGLPGATGAGHIDLGGGSNAFGTSKGGNNFRGFDGVGGHYAIHLHNTDAGITVAAQDNIFDVGVNPALVVQDGNNGGGTGSVVVTNALDSNHAFVQNLFAKLLGRVGSLGVGGEIDLWVGKLPKLGRKGVARAILYSDESLARIVDRMYLDRLGRTASTTEKVNWINLLKKGASLAGIEARILTTPEYMGRTTTGFVQSLYLNVLHRPATVTEVAKGYAALPALGLRGFAASITGGKERRLNFATDLYRNLLHREPTALEATTLAGKSSNLLTLQLLVLMGDEFFGHG